MGLASRYNLAIIINEQRRGQAVRELTQEMVLLRQQMGIYGGSARDAGNRTDQFRDKTKRLANTLKRELAAALVIGGAAFVRFSQQGIQEFAKFDQKMHEVYTLMPDTSDKFREEMSNDIRRVGMEFGLLTDESVPALYQALSAGVPEPNAVKAVEEATKAAIAGVSNVSDTMRLGMAVVNAYGGQLYTLGDAYDITFQLIDKGVPKMRDWTQSLQNVLSVASETHTPFEDIAAALAVMTRQGDDAAQSTELLSFLLIQLGVTGTAAGKAFVEATGQSYRDWIASGKGLIEGLKELDDYAKRTGQSLGDMIAGDTKFFRDQQAYRAIVELTGIHMQELLDMAEEFKAKNTAGLMDEAFVTASDNAQFELDQLKSSWNDVKIAIGEAWLTQENFLLGITGEEMIERLTLVANIFSGTHFSFQREDFAGLIELPAILAKIQEFQDMPWIMETIMGSDFDAALKDAMFRLAEYAGSYEEFIDLIVKSDINYKTYNPEHFSYPTYGTGEDIGIIINDLEMTTAEIYHQAMSNQSLRLELERRSREEERIHALQEKYRNEDRARAESLAGVAARTSELTEEQRKYFDEMSDVPDDWLFPQGTAIEDIIYWVPIEVHRMSDAVSNYVDKTKQDIGSLFDAQDELEEAAGAWKEIIVNNQKDIGEVMDSLTADLTDEQRDAMWEVVRTAEEGGADWLDAWTQLQGDLTETQRFELVARLADLEGSSGTIKAIWDGDKDAAIEAAGSIIQYIQAVQENYDNLAISISNAKFIERFGEDTVEAQLALIAVQVAMGQIEEDEAELLRGQIIKAGELEGVLDTMYDAYLADGELSKQETENIAKAIQTVDKYSRVLTEEGLKALLDKMLSDTGGFPKAGEVIKLNMTDKLEESKTKADALVNDGPYVPDFKVNTIEFDRGYATMLTKINDSLGPWTIEFTANYPNLPSPSDSDANHSSGVRNATVPSGFPNDSFLVGLTSGEQYSVYRRNERSQLQGGIDNSRTNITINNHTRAAAKVAKAQIDAAKRKRMNSFMGG